MCGIVGILARTDAGRAAVSRLEAATDCLAPRGPDHGAVFRHGDVGLGHRRLAIIDTSADANQPMSDATGRYTMIYNGEAYNYRSVRDRMIAGGHRFRTHSDTEVVLESLIAHGPEALAMFNGFFALALYDREEGSLLVARDRMGIKPLCLYEGDDFVAFASEFKALLTFPVPREIDPVSLYQYLQLSYIPAPDTVLSGVVRVHPGDYWRITRDGASRHTWYRPPAPPRQPPARDYGAACRGLVEQMERSVERRLVADVEVASFLSGGLDSTIIAGTAARLTDKLHTFSIGFPENQRYDETEDARAAAAHFGTDHTVIPLKRDELFDHYDDFMDCLDEPFADPASIAMYVLSKVTSAHVKVALSGDGADEIFGGYVKHRAHLLARRALVRMLARPLEPLARAFPASRETAFGDGVRRLQRFTAAAARSHADQYWRWCTFVDESEARHYLAAPVDTGEYLERKSAATRWMGTTGRIDDVLYSDIMMVLPDDMLHKVDRMSMAHGLEVRVPFLDHELVEYAVSLPGNIKVNGDVGKRVLRDAFADLVPRSVLEKPKHGFDVPLLDWFRGPLRGRIEKKLLSDDLVASQGIFDRDEVAKLRTRLFSRPHGDIVRQTWNLIVFQHWWLRYLDGVAVNK